MRNYNKYKKFGKKKKLINPIKITIVMVILMITMAIGYASYTDTLQIRGEAKIASFTITYHTNGGNLSGNVITTYNATSNALLPMPTRTNYSFTGWYENENLTGDPIDLTPTRK